MAPSAPGQPIGDGDEVIMSGARALGMQDANPEEIVDRIMYIASAIRQREDLGDWTDFPYDATQRQAIIAAEKALIAMRGQE